MSEHNIGILVNSAKGDDRSIREYARDSGVDAAVISKIINGVYIPKKPEVYEALTSVEASPRGGVTYEQLIEASHWSKSYQEGVKAGRIASDKILKAIGCLPIAAISIASGSVLSAVAESLSPIKKKGDDEKLTRMMTEHQRFVTLSNGLLYGALGAKGIVFQIKSVRNKELESQFDTYLEIVDKEVSEYIFRYLYLPKDDPYTKYVANDTSKRIIEELLFLEPSNGRKVSIVTDHSEVYDFMLQYKDKLSYNGELSIILVDIGNVKLLREDYISHYIGEDAPGEMLIV